MLRLARSTRTSLPLVTASLLVAALVGCSKDDGGPADPGGNSPPAKNTGYFIDSAVGGLGYVSGSSSGFTDATGKFVFEKNVNVTFSIGDIDLGSGPPATTMCPIQLVSAAADVTNQEVTNIARFLQTIDDDNDPSNGIEITAAVQTAAAGQSIDFQQDPTAFENDANVQTVVSNLTAATQAGEHALVGIIAAQDHLRASIRAAYQGTYTGLYCVDPNAYHYNGGTWTLNVGADGAVSIGFNGTPTFSIFGTMDINGIVSILLPNGTAVYAGFTPDFGGRWYYQGLSGSFSESTKSCSN